MFKLKNLRTIQFPQDASIGRLYIPEIGGYKFYSLAQGTVSVPAGIKLILRVAPDSAGLLPLASLNPDDLSELSLVHTNLSDDELRHISGLTGLTALHFDYTSLSGRGLNLLSRLRPYFLSARRSHFSDEGASRIRALSSLTTVNLSQSRVTDLAIDSLANLPSLTCLSLWDNPITNEAGKGLSRIKSLTELYLGGTRFGDEGTLQLAELPSLTTLELERTQITDNSLHALAEMPVLTELGLSHNYITDIGLEELANFLRSGQ